jgi:ABC-type glycerol-3-phosphate transport system permease component
MDVTIDEANNKGTGKRKTTQREEQPVSPRAELILQVVLIGIGLFVSFPIILAILTSFKQPQDIINYPPTLLPEETVRVEVEGYDEPLALFRVMLPDADESVELARVGREGGELLLVDPDAPDDIIRVQNNEAERVERISFTLENYETAWTSQPFGRYFLNSVIQTGIIVIFQVFFSILAAFAFSVLQFPGRDTLFYLILGSLMVPFQLTFIPNFIFVSNLGLANTYAGLTLPFLASAFGVFLLRQFFRGIPKELHEAALIDGASNWLYLWRVVVPLSKGAISAFAIFAFLSAWSQYLWPLVITNEVDMRTIQIGIRFFLFDQERGADWGGIMAAAVMALLPTLLIFLVAQRQLVRGIAMTGLKG